MGSKSRAPDYSGMNEAAVATVDLSREQFDWAKDIYESERPARESAAASAQQVADAQIAAMQQNYDIAQQAQDHYTSTFKPIETAIATDAMNYDTEARRNEAAQSATADVQSQISAQRAATIREQQRSGVNPASGKALATGALMDVGAAKAKAGAANTARQNVEMQGWARKMDAASLGRGISSSQATSAGIATQAGSAGAGNALNALTPANQANAAMSGAYGQAIAGYGQAANIYGNIANAQAAQNASNNGLWGALGSVAGSLGAQWLASDVHAKENIRDFNPDDALRTINETPVALWDYKPESGFDDGRSHVGPMAQDLNAAAGAAGETIAPNGTAIDMVSANGMNMAAIQALNKKVDELGRKVERKRG